MSLLFNMLSRLVITFLPRSKHLLISWLQSPSAVILEPKKIKPATVSPSVCHEVMGPDVMILVFRMFSFKPIFSLSSFTFIKRLFSSSLSATRVVSSACLRLLIFLPAIFFFLFLFYFIWKLITLQYCGGFPHTFMWISHGCTCVPHPDPPSHLTPHPIPLGHPSAPALSTLSHALNLDWRSISHMVICVFQLHAYFNTIICE